jgi:hypothetical protein
MPVSIENRFDAVGGATRSDNKLRKLANESGLLMLEQAFVEQLQALYDEEETEENGGGLYRELIPFWVTAALESSPELGIGDEIYNELSRKLGTV